MGGHRQASHGTLTISLVTCFVASLGTGCQGRRALLQTLGRVASIEREIDSAMSSGGQGNDSAIEEKVQGGEAESLIAGKGSDAMPGPEPGPEPDLWPAIRCKGENLSELAASLADLHLSFRQGDISKLHEYAIPRFIHQKSMGTREEYQPKPPMGTWPERHQGYTHIVWSDASGERFVERCIPEILPVFRAVPGGVFRSDMLRYLLLLVFGGIWGDDDTEPLRDFDGWLNGVEGESTHAKIRIITGVEYDNPDWGKHGTGGYGSAVQLLQWTVAAAPGHPVLWYAVQQMVVNIVRLLREFFEVPAEVSSVSSLEDVEDLWRSGPKVPLVLPEPGAPMKREMHRGHVLGTTGPFLWTRAVLWKMKQGAWSLEDMQNLTVGRTFGDVVVFPLTAFSPGRGHDAKPETDPEARVKHHFHGSWLGDFK